MRNILNILLVSFWVVFLCNCSSMSEQQFTTELRNRSLEDAAKYYCEMRPKLKFADSVFSNEIIPQLDSCKFSLLQNMRTIVENTPVYSRINTIYTNRWTSIVDSAEQTLWDYSDQQMSLLIN